METTRIGRYEYGLKFVETHPLELMHHPDLVAPRGLLIERLPRSGGLLEAPTRDFRVRKQVYASG